MLIFGNFGVINSAKNLQIALTSPRQFYHVYNTNLGCSSQTALKNMQSLVLLRLNKFLNILGGFHYSKTQSNT